MHEFSIAAALVQNVTNLLRAYPDARPARVALQVGVLAGVDPSALRNALAAAAAGTPLEKTEFAIEEVGISAYCAACRASVAIVLPCLACPKCGSGHIRIAAGHELMVKQIEIETPDAASQRQARAHMNETN